jgi:radical SAM superfamily enzyme YgiQ (UPF0313 family)
MRVLLINPFYPISETPSPPLGLAYLGAALEQAGVQVKVLDYVVYPYRRDALESVLKEFKPHVAGATAVSMTFDHAKQILRDVKTIDPQILTLDVVVLGEGEATLVELLHAIECARNFDTVSGIAYRLGSKIRTTPKRKRIKNLDALPSPARYLLPLGRYRALGMPMSITTSRGCPYQCIFCVGRKMVGARVRYHSADRVAAELQTLANLRFHQINIADDLFTANQNHCLAVCEEILRRNLDRNQLDRICAGRHGFRKAFIKDEGRRVHGRQFWDRIGQSSHIKYDQERNHRSTDAGCGQEMPAGGDQPVCIFYSGTSG